MDSQASVSSSASTVPLDLIHDQDNDFVDEIDRIYFGNIEINLRDDISYSDLNDEDDEDCESDKENIDSNTSNIGVEMQWIKSLWIWETNTFSESNLQLWKIV